MSEDYQIRHSAPSVTDYRRLRTGSGLNDKSYEAAVLGLAGSWYAVTIMAGSSGMPVGMGRIVGDGGCHFQIVDVCVLPEHQGRGLGRRIMQELTTELERRAPATAYVTLIADGDAQHLYRKFGFVDTAPDSIGMARTVEGAYELT
jgi:ribosomal protein S18 acetylase RimI-like enzyme